MTEILPAERTARELAVTTPALIQRSGSLAETRFLEFFAVTIRNRNRPHWQVSS